MYFWYSHIYYKCFNSDLNLINIIYFCQYTMFYLRLMNFKCKLDFDAFKLNLWIVNYCEMDIFHIIKMVKVASRERVRNIIKRWKGKCQLKIKKTKQKNKSVETSCECKN